MTLLSQTSFIQSAGWLAFGINALLLVTWLWFLSRAISPKDEIGLLDKQKKIPGAKPKDKAKIAAREQYYQKAADHRVRQLFMFVSLQWLQGLYIWMLGATATTAGYYAYAAKVIPMSDGHLERYLPILKGLAMQTLDGISFNALSTFWKVDISVHGDISIKWLSFTFGLLSALMLSKLISDLTLLGQFALSMKFWRAKTIAINSGREIPRWYQKFLVMPADASEGPSGDCLPQPTNQEFLG